MSNTRTNWLKIGLAGGAVAVLVGVLFFTDAIEISDAEQLAQFETAAGPENIDILLGPYPVRVKTPKNEIALGYVTVRMAVDAASYRGHVCKRIDKVGGALTAVIGRRALSTDEWRGIDGRHLADRLRHRFNRALRKNYVAKVMLDRGRHASGVATPCAPGES